MKNFILSFVFGLLFFFPTFPALSDGISYQDAVQATAFFRQC